MLKRIIATAAAARLFTPILLTVWSKGILFSFAFPGEDNIGAVSLV
ncbi:MAG: hypothetical protein R2744_05010 [Bacteroidales bacterium]